VTEYDVGCNPAAHVHTSTCWWDLFEAAWQCPATRRFPDRPVAELSRRPPEPAAVAPVR
jgi:hypothetical protein